MIAKQGLPLPSSPLVDLSTGQITSEWLRVMSTLIARTGGAAGKGGSVSDVSDQSLLALLQSELPDVQTLPEPFPLWMIEVQDAAAQADLLASLFLQEPADVVTDIDPSQNVFLADAIS